MKKRLEITTKSNQISTYILIFVLFLLCSCSQKGEDDFLVAEAEQTPVSFSMYLAPQGETRAGVPGEMDNATLQAEGFGVFAYLTDEKDWNGSPAAKDDATPNFMYNQQVLYSANVWTYTPMKYWPNDFSTGAVDDQDDDRADNPATGSVNGGRLSFFAYAPYVEVTPGTGAVTGEASYGITALTGNTATDDPLVTYKLNPSVTFRDAADASFSLPSPFVKDNVDLLWGVAATNHFHTILNNGKSLTEGLPLTDLTKPTTSEAVNFRFLHATGMLRLLVQGAFDELSPGEENVDLWQTRILVNRLNLVVGKKEGELNLCNTTANVAKWDVAGKADQEIHLFSTMKERREYDEGFAYINLMNPTLNNERYAKRTMPVDYEVTPSNSDWSSVTSGILSSETYMYSTLTPSVFETLPEGVTNEAKNVLNLPKKDTDGDGVVDSEDETGYGILFIPASTESHGRLKSINVRICYDVITKDASLVRNKPAGFSIIRNDIARTLTLPDDYYFDANKIYTLRMVLGLTTVKFEVDTIDEWGVPVTLTPLVKDWKVVTTEFDI